MKIFCLFPACVALLASNASAQSYANFEVGDFTNPLIYESLPGSQTKTETITLPADSEQAGETFTVSIGVSGGSGWGTAEVIPGSPMKVGPTAVNVDSGSVNPDFSGNTTGLNVLLFYGSADSTVTSTFDFSTLSGGALKAGSVIAWADVDGMEKAVFHSNTANWYSLSPAGFFQTDMSSPGAGSGTSYGSGQSDPAIFAAASAVDVNTMSLLGGTPGVYTNTAVNFIVLQQDISQLTVTSTGSGPDIQFCQSFALATMPIPVPEPSSSTLLGLTASLFFLRRKRSSN